MPTETLVAIGVAIAKGASTVGASVASAASAAAPYITGLSLLGGFSTAVMGGIGAFQQAKVDSSNLQLQGQAAQQTAANQELNTRMERLAQIQRQRAALRQLQQAQSDLVGQQASRGADVRTGSTQDLLTAMTDDFNRSLFDDDRQSLLRQYGFTQQAVQGYRQADTALGAAQRVGRTAFPQFVMNTLSGVGRTVSQANQLYSPTQATNAVPSILGPQYDINPRI